MTETQTTVADWSDATFGKPRSNLSSAARANKEMAELLMALAEDDRHPKAAEECADIVICLYRLVRDLGADLQAEIDKKMFVNRAREWRLDGNGHGYHVERPTNGATPGVNTDDLVGWTPGDLADEWDRLVMSESDRPAVDFLDREGTR